MTERLLTITGTQVRQVDGHLYLQDGTEVTWDSTSKSLKRVVRTQEYIPDYVPSERPLLLVGNSGTARSPIHHGVTKLYNHVEAWYTGPKTVQEPKVQNVPENELIKYGRKREAYGKKHRMKKWLTVQVTAEETVSYSTRAPRVWEGETGSQLVIQGKDVAAQIDPGLLTFIEGIRAQAQGR